MRTLDKFISLLNENKPFEKINTDIEVWRKTEEIITVTKQVGNIEDEEILISVEKLLLRSLISYLTKYQKQIDWNFTTVCDLLKEHFNKMDNGASSLDEIFESFKECETLPFCYEQYMTARQSEEFNEAVVCLLNRLSVLEILEKESDEFINGKNNVIIR